MNVNLKIVFAIGVFSAMTLSVSGQVTCHIKGKIIGRESKNILLHKATEDVRIKNVLIPIVADTFEYQLAVPVSEGYNLVFEDELQKGGWHPILFFPESGNINFTLYPIKEHDKNTIEGGNLNQVHKAFNLAYDKEFGPKFKSLYNSLKELNDNHEGEGPKADAIKKELEATHKKGQKWRDKYIENNPSLVTYFFFVANLQQVKYTNDIIQHRYSLFSKKYPTIRIQN